MLSLYRDLKSFKPKHSSGSFDKASLIVVSSLCAQCTNSQDVKTHLYNASKLLSLLVHSRASENCLSLSLLYKIYESSNLQGDLVADEFGHIFFKDLLSLVPFKTSLIPNKRIRRQKQLAALSNASTDAQNVKCAEMIVRGSRIFCEEGKLTSLINVELSENLEALKNASPVLKAQLEAVASSDRTVINIMNFSARRRTSN